MSKPSAGRQTNSLPHPLAIRLIGAIAKGADVLEIGAGSGRNQRALLARGARVTAIEPGPWPAFAAAFDAALSTHALLHGTPATLEAALQHIHSALRPGGSLYATFGSKRDARYGSGRRIAAHVFAPEEGDEIGVAHTYWNEPELRVMLKDFELIEITELQVDDIAGTWAHKTSPLSEAFHWTIIARRPPLA